MQCRHARFPPKNPPLFFRSYFIFLIFLLFIGSGVSCSGGALAPGGGGLPGTGPVSYGAPPLSLPGPIALNMQSIHVFAPDVSGLSAVTIESGAGSPGNLMELRNLGDVAWFRRIEKWWIPSAYALGETLTVEIASDGSVPGPLKIAAGPGEWLEFKQCLKSDPKFCSAGVRVEVPASGSNSGSSGVISSPPSGKSLEMRMTVDPHGNVILFEGGMSVRRWNWRSLFFSTAYAQESSAESKPVFSPSTTIVDCPGKDGPAALIQDLPDSVKQEQNDDSGSCKITRMVKKEISSLRIEHCRDPRDLQSYVYGPGKQIWLAAAAGDTVYFLNEKKPPEETDFEVYKAFRFPNPVYKVAALLSGNDPSILVAVRGDPSLVAIQPDLSAAACFSSFSYELQAVREMTAFARDPSEPAFFIAAREAQGSSILRVSPFEGKWMKGGRIATLRSKIPSPTISGLVYLGTYQDEFTAGGTNFLLSFYELAFIDETNHVTFLRLLTSASRNLLMRLKIDPEGDEEQFSVEIPEASGFTALESDGRETLAVMEKGGSRLFLFHYENDPEGTLVTRRMETLDLTDGSDLVPEIVYNGGEEEFVVSRRSGRVERMRVPPSASSGLVDSP
jgi:hypothetical protein